MSPPARRAASPTRPSRRSTSRPRRSTTDRVRPTNGATDTNCDANHVSNLDDPTYGLAHDLSLPANEVPAFNWITPNNCSDAHDATCQGNNLSGRLQRQRHARLHPGRPTGRRPRGDDAGQLHRRALRGRPVPALLHPDDRAVGGLRRRRADRHHLRRGQPSVHRRQQLQQRARPRRQLHLLRSPADQPTFGAPGTTAPGADSLYGAYGLQTDAAGENINGQQREHRADRARTTPR